VRPIDIEHEGQDNAVDRAPPIDQPFEIIAQAVKARRGLGNSAGRKPIDAGRNIIALIAAKPKNAPVCVCRRP
jgi:hypothetical protein